MLDFLQRNKILLLFLLIWYLTGAAAAPVFYVVAILSLLLFWRRGLYFEILAGFFFILILSDNLKPATDFAKEFKNLYIVILAAITYLDLRNKYPVNRTYIYLLPFLILAIPGLFFSPVPTIGAQKMISYFLLFYAVPQLFTAAFRERGALLLKDILFLGLVMLLIGQLIRFTDPSVAFSHGGRFRGVFGNPNGLGIFISLLVVLTVVARAYFKNLFSKGDLIWIVVILGSSLLMSGSRTSIIAVILFLVFVRFFRLSPFIGFIALLFLAFAAEAISSNLLQIVNYLGLSDFFRIETLQEGSGRYIAWNFAWDAIQQNLWWGRGFAFDEWLMDINQDLLNELGHQGGVHNTYLIIWLNAGLLGLVAFLRAIMLLFIKAARHSAIATPAFWLVLFSITLEPWLAASLNPFTILFLITITLLTDEIFQPYLRGKMNSIENPNHISVLA